MALTGHVEQFPEGYFAGNSGTAAMLRAVALAVSTPEDKEAFIRLSKREMKRLAKAGHIEVPIKKPKTEEGTKDESESCDEREEEAAAANPGENQERDKNWGGENKSDEERDEDPIPDDPLGICEKEAGTETKKENQQNGIQVSSEKDTTRCVRKQRRGKSEPKESQEGKKGKSEEQDKEMKGKEMPPKSSSTERGYDRGKEAEHNSSSSSSSSSDSDTSDESESDSDGRDNRRHRYGNKQWEKEDEERP